MKEILHTIAEGNVLPTEQAEQAMHLMMRGESAPEHTAALLMGLRARGEAMQELVAFARVMREYAVKVDLEDPDAIDLCGTGGDSTGTFNISTSAAFVCAGAGVTVAKHGNRSVSSMCGSADVLEALGVKVDLQKEGVEHCLREAGIAFLFAPFFHPAMKHVGPVRRSLGVRTFFNILGPLCNPAGVRRQLVGAFSADVAQRMADILAELGSERVIGVHAEDGMDEISICAPTYAYEYSADDPVAVEMGKSRTVEIRPERFGFGCRSLELLRGGSATDNAEILRRVLSGEGMPHRDVVLLNAAYALFTSGRYSDVDASMAAARESIDTGAALRKLKHLIEVSSAAPAAAA